VLVLSTASLTAVFLTSSDACTITLLSVCSATPSSEATASEGVPAFVIYLVHDQETFWAMGTRAL